MPVRREYSARVQLAEAACGKLAKSSRSIAAHSPHQMSATSGEAGMVNRLGWARETSAHRTIVICAPLGYH